MTKKEIILIFVLVIIAFVKFFFFLPDKPDYDKFVGQNINIEGIIVESPDIRLYNQHLILKPNNQKSNLLIIAPKEISVFYGDKVKVTGRLSSPENFITQAGKEFDYEKYLANRDIYFIIESSNLEIISKHNGSWLKYSLFKLRDFFIKNIERVIISPQKDLSTGLILGTRGGFDTKMNNEFITTGTIHIVALSGYNITIIAQNTMNFFILFFGATTSVVFGILVIILFIIMTGANATAIRAGIMAIIILFAKISGRNYEAGRALIIAAILMLTYDLRIINDLSFQLSFLATAGILFITPKILPHIHFITDLFKLREIVATTISATLAVLPILLYSTGIFSIVSLPANILILPFIPMTMFFSFLTGITGFISPFLSLPFAYISDLFLSYILFVIHFFASLPFASLTIKSFPLIITVLLYLLLLRWIFKKISTPGVEI